MSEDYTNDPNDPELEAMESMWDWLQYEWEMSQKPLDLPTDEEIDDMADREPPPF